VPDRLDRVPVLGIPLRGGTVQRGKLAGRATPQLELQQFGE